MKINNNSPRKHTTITIIKSDTTKMTENYRIMVMMSREAIEIDQEESRRMKNINKNNLANKRKNPTGMIMRAEMTGKRMIKRIL